MHIKANYRFHHPRDRAPRFPWRCVAIGLIAFSLSAYAENQLSVRDLLRLGTRLRAFQQFCLRTQPGEFEQYGWGDLKIFGESHRELTCSVLRSGTSAPRYLITWQTNPIDSWRDLDSCVKASATPTGLLFPVEDLQSQIVTAEGAPQLDGISGWIGDGNIADFNGDGEPEVIERVKRLSGPTFYEYLQIRGLDIASKVSLAVLYNTHPTERALGNTWGFQLRFDHNGTYVLELGPVTALSGVEPKVKFRWAKDRHAWIGPGAKKGDHYKVMEQGEPSIEADRIASAGGLGYPLCPVSKGGSVERIPEPKEPNSSLKALSKPYQYKSLKGLSDERLFQYMAERRGVDDDNSDRLKEATAVPNFWKLEPKDSALAYVRQNRNPAVSTQYLLGFLSNKDTAPSEGDVTLFDDGGGDGAELPDSAYIHQLHCGHDGSYLVYGESIHFWRTEKPTRFAFQKLDLPYQQASHLFKTIWWMSRIRSRSLTCQGQSGEYSSGGSTADGFGSVQITSGNNHLTVEGARVEPLGKFLGAGQLNEGYDRSAFINLMVQLFDREVPDHLGKPWSLQKIPLRWDETFRIFENPTPEEEAVLRNRTEELFRLSRKHGLAPSIALQAVNAVGEMGWLDLSYELKQLFKQLPPRTEYEKHQAKMDQELKRWKERLGEGASERAHSEREQRRHPSENLVEDLITTSGSTSPTKAGVNSKANPLSKEEEAKFAEFDAFYEKQKNHLLYAPRRETEIANLRKAIPMVLRKLSSYKDPEGLYQWALEDEDAIDYVLARLARIAPKRASGLLRSLEARCEGNYKSYYANARQRIELGETNDQVGMPWISEEARKKMMIDLLDPKADYNTRENALKALVPSNDPTRYPEPAISASLVELLTRKAGPKEIMPEQLSMAAALRLGEPAWEPILIHSDTQQLGLSNLIHDLPALTLLTQRAPELHRAQMREILSRQLVSSSVFPSLSFWSIWQLDLRELKPALERIATSGPEDCESLQGLNVQSQRTPLTGRYHEARQIAALWNEEDLLTRAKLLVAFCVGNAGQLADESTGALEQLTKQLSNLRNELTPVQLEDLGDFLHLCEVKRAVSSARGGNPTQVSDVLRSVRSSLSKHRER